MQALIIILDGAADRPLLELGRKTPLEVAQKPTIDRLTSEGSCGLLYAISPGVRPGSDVAHLALFGYDPYRYYTGRGPFEALGAGVDLRPGDIAFRTNVATVNNDLIVIDRRAGRYVNPEEAREIERIINEDIGKIINEKYGVELIYKHTTEHRGVLILRGEKISYRVGNTDPHAINKRVLDGKPLDDSEEAKRTSKILQEFTKLVYEKLSQSEINITRRREGKPLINMILLRGAGILPKIKPINEVYNIRCSMIAGIAVIKGIGKALGFDVIDVPGYRGAKTDDYNRAFEEAVKALSNYDIVVLHVKPTDSASHDGDVMGKIRIIEQVDAALRRVLEKVPDNTYIVITCDHATPVKVKDHTGDPVPIMMWGPDLFRDEVSKYCEKACSEGFWGVLKGLDLMPIITNYLGRQEKFGE